ncbi:MAG: DUF5946 family protein [Rubrobacter sp.]
MARESETEPDAEASRQGPALRPCVGCGALVPDTDGPTHAYIGASPGCWSAYGELLAKDYGEYSYPQGHRLAVDAYAVQHPGTPSRRSTQSVIVHLVGLHLSLERGHDFRRSTEAIRRVLADRENFVWLEPPPSLGEITVLDVLEAENLAEHTALVERWARSTWEAWSPHHETVRRWAG